MLYIPQACTNHLICSGVLPESVGYKFAVKLSSKPLLNTGFLDDVLFLFFSFNVFNTELVQRSVRLSSFGAECWLVYCQFN